MKTIIDPKTGKPIVFPKITKTIPSKIDRSNRVDQLGMEKFTSDRDDDDQSGRFSGMSGLERLAATSAWTPMTGYYSTGNGMMEGGEDFSACDSDCGHCGRCINGQQA